MADFSSKPWSTFSEADYADADAYCSACLIDLNPDGKPRVKGLCKLPIKEPGGAINRNAVAAAYAVLNGSRGGVDAPAAAKAQARQRLESLRAQMKMGANNNQ